MLLNLQLKALYTWLFTPAERSFLLNYFDWVKFMIPCLAIVFIQTLAAFDHGIYIHAATACLKNETYARIEFEFLIWVFFLHLKQYELCNFGFNIDLPTLILLHP